MPRDELLATLLKDARATIAGAGNYRPATDGAEAWTIDGRPACARSPKASRWSLAGSLRRATVNLAWGDRINAALREVLSEFGYGELDTFNAVATHAEALQILDAAIAAAEGDTMRLYLWTADPATGYLYRAPTPAFAECIAGIINRRTGRNGGLVRADEAALGSPSYELLSRRLPGVLAEAVQANGVPRYDDPVIPSCWGIDEWKPGYGGGTTQLIVVLPADADPRLIEKLRETLDAGLPVKRQGNLLKLHVEAPRVSAAKGELAAKVVRAWRYGTGWAAPGAEEVPACGGPH